MDGEPVSRRGFIQLSAGALATVGGGGSQPQLAGQLAGDGQESPIGLDDDVDGAAILLGPFEHRPDPDDDYFDQWQTYHFVYVATTDYGGISWIKHTDERWQDIMVNPQTQVEEVRVSEYKSFFNHTFARPSSPDTKNWDFTAADIAKQDSEIELQAASTNLTSEQRGNYPPGSESVPGVAWRMTAAPTAGEAFAGYFVDSDDDQSPDEGFGFGMDTTGTFAFLAKGGTVHKVHQGDWNSGVEVDTDPFLLHYPRICRFPHLFYGGGGIEFRIIDHETNPPKSKLKTVHVMTPETVASAGSPFDDGPPFDQPNLPVNFTTNGLSGANLRANAAHYERGQDEGETRVNGEHFNVTGIGTTDWTALITWQKRTGWDMVNVKPIEFNVFAATNDVKLELQLGATLSNTSFSRATHSADSETAVVVDTSGTIDTGGDGERRAVGSAAAGQGSKFGGSTNEALTFNLASDVPVTLAAQGVGGEADAFGHVEWREFF